MHAQHNELRHQQHSQNVQHLSLNAEQRHAPMPGNTSGHQHTISESVLAKETAVGYIHNQAENEYGCKTDLSRMLYRPVQQDDRNEIRSDHQYPAGQRQHIEHECDKESQADVRRLGGQQYLVRVGFSKCRNCHQFFPLPLRSPCSGATGLSG